MKNILLAILFLAALLLEFGHTDGGLGFALGLVAMHFFVRIRIF